MATKKKSTKSKKRTVTKRQVKGLARVWGGNQWARNGVTLLFDADGVALADPDVAEYVCEQHYEFELGDEVEVEAPAQGSES